MRTGASLNEAIGQAHTLAAERLAAGFDQSALDGAARQGFANGNFEDAPDEGLRLWKSFIPKSAKHPPPLLQLQPMSTGPYRSGQSAKWYA